MVHISPQRFLAPEGNQHGAQVWFITFIRFSNVHSSCDKCSSHEHNSSVQEDSGTPCHNIICGKIVDFEKSNDDYVHHGPSKIASARMTWGLVLLITAIPDPFQHGERAA